MRVFRLVLLGVACFLVALLVSFPAAPVIDRIRPQLGPVALDGVSGPLWSGRVASARSTDDLLPLEFSNVTWRLAPAALPGGGGARVGFEGYGGEGAGLVRRTWGNDLVVEDFRMTARAKALEPLLPAPIAAFDGALEIDIARLEIVDELLRTFVGSIVWDDAVLERPIPARFGRIEVSVAPDGAERHAGTLEAAGGDVRASGTFTIAPNGDYTIDLLATPEASAPREIVDVLRRGGRPEGAGYRLRQSGNVNRLM